ncbi:ABC transporter substrate-binding protein [Parafrankia discariae]|uniref:ABC transporter substrate-binding protein n=1 Tax=Parafrankia discariae TaxID=365528 RepID=UPI00036E3CD9|nr:ABC transporter substrate-binding protein [Parafrankia discariae]
MLAKNEISRGWRDVETVRFPRVTPPREVEVLVVGAGPSGLATALELNHDRVQVAVVDAATSASLVRAGAMGHSSRTVELFRRWGVYEAIRAGWTFPPEWNHGGGRLRTSLVGHDLLDPPGPSFRKRPGNDFSFEDSIRRPQTVLQHAFLRRLAERGTTVAGGWRLLGFHEGEDTVTALLEDVDSAERREVRARYLVGADGGSSDVRRRGSSGGSGTGSASGGVINWAGTWSVSTWDPVVAGGTRNTQYLDLVYDSLTQVDSQGNAHPQQARSWEYNTTGDAVTFHLRPGLKFTDGTPVNAEAWQYQINRAKTQKNSQLAGDLDSVRSIDVIDDLTFRINLTQPDHHIPTLFGARGAGLLASETAARNNPQALATTAPVGSGPFKVESLTPDASVSLVKNPDFWDAENIHVDRIEITFNNDPNSVVQGIRTGTYNFAIGDVAQIDPAKKAGLQVLDDWGYGYQGYFVPVNLNKAPFDNPKVVQAIHYAVNREQFVEQAAFGHGEVTAEPYPSYYPAYAQEAKDLHPYNPDKARQLLAEAGYNTTDRRLSLPFVVSQPTPPDEVLQSQFKAVGVDLDIKVDPNWSTSFFAKTLAITDYSYAGRDSFGQTLTANFGGGPLNLSGPFQSAEFKAALAKVRATPLDSPDLKKNLAAATVAGLTSNPNIYTYATPRPYILATGISPLPKLPGQISFRGVTIGSS